MHSTESLCKWELECKSLWPRVIAKRRSTRSKSTPPNLPPDPKLNILKGVFILITCTILMCFEVCRMYHGIRGLAAIKLHVIHNVLESANNQPLVCEPFIDREVRFATTYYLLLDKIFAMLGSNKPWSASPMIVARSLRPLWLDSPFVVTLKPDPCHFALSTRAITLNVAGQLFHECAPYLPPSNVRSIR